MTSGLAMSFTASMHAATAQWPLPFLLLLQNTWQQVVGTHCWREAVTKLLHVQPENAHLASWPPHPDEQQLPGYRHSLLDRGRQVLPSFVTGSATSALCPPQARHGQTDLTQLASSLLLPDQQLLPPLVQALPRSDAAVAGGEGCPCSLLAPLVLRLPICAKVQPLLGLQAASWSVTEWPPYRPRSRVVQVVCAAWPASGGKPLRTQVHGVLGSAGSAGTKPLSGFLMDPEAGGVHFWCAAMPAPGAERHRSTRQASGSACSKQARV